MEVKWDVHNGRTILNGQSGNYVCPHEVPIGNDMGIIYRIYVQGQSRETRKTEEVAKKRLVELVERLG
ncbi:MAG: hypothetical protein AB7S38_36415 [Vulcanimicrobiota bacterium]